MPQGGIIGLMRIELGSNTGGMHMPVMGLSRDRPNKSHSENHRCQKSRAL
jgi:hypothetical protein